MTDVNKVLALANSGQYKDLLEFAGDVDEDQIFIKPKCKLCNSPHRVDAEAYCEKMKWNYSATEKWLATKGEAVSDKTIKDHIEDHYRPLVKRIQIKHYANELSAYMKVRHDAAATFAACRAILWKEMLEIGAESGRLDIFERRKSAELLAKLTGQILACEEAEKKNAEDFKPIHIAAEKLQQIIQIEASTASPEVQQRLTRVIETFLDNIADHNLSGK